MYGKMRNGAAIVNPQSANGYLLCGMTLICFSEQNKPVLLCILRAFSAFTLLING